MGKLEKTAASAADDAEKQPFQMKIRLATRPDAAALQAIYSFYVENTTVSFEYEAPSVAEMERRIAEVEGVYPFLVCVVEEEGGKDAGDFSVAANNEEAQDVSSEKGGENASTLPGAAPKKNAKNGGNGGSSDDASVWPAPSTAAGVENVKTGSVGERIVGYALAHRAFERAAYSWVAETAVYVDRNWRRRGIGEALYSALIEILEAQGLRSLYAVVVAENKASVEFHRRAGYRDFATFKSAGWKFGRWLDVVWLERTLGVWRDAESNAGKNKALGETLETEGEEKRNPAPLPIRAISELLEERLAKICAAAAR